MIRIGLIADTHGLLRPQALAALAGCRQIIHAGDVGGPEILVALERLAPVAAVRGNNDQADWAAALPESLDLEIGGCRVHVLHDRKMLACDPAASGIDVVVAGHSHRPLVERRTGVLHVNPGSAGPRRFRLPVSVGELCIERGIAEARILPLEP